MNMIVFSPVLKKPTPLYHVTNQELRKNGGPQISQIFAISPSTFIVVGWQKENHDKAFFI